MTTHYATDTIALDTKQVTADGFVTIPAVIARTGIQIYHGYNFPELGRDAMSEVRLYRPPEEVFAEDSLTSFEGVPVTVEHPSSGLVTADTWKQLSVGDVRRVARNNDLMKAVITIRDKTGLDALNSGKRELSNGYRFVLDMTPGVTPQGESYDGVQRNIRGNHVAIVDAARCGPVCRVSDNQPKGNQTMTLRTVAVDGIQLEVSETAASVIVKLEKDRNDALALAVDSDSKAKKLADDHKAELDKLKADHQTALDALKKDVMTPEARDAMVSEWVAMRDTAARLAPKVTTDGKTCVQVRLETAQAVVAADASAKALADAILGGVALDKATPDQVKVVFKALDASHKPAAGDSSVANALLGKPATTQAADSGQDAYSLFTDQLFKTN